MGLFFLLLTYLNTFQIVGDYMRDRFVVFTIVLCLVFSTLLTLCIVPVFAEGDSSGDALPEDTEHEFVMDSSVDVMEQEQFEQYEVIISKLDSIIDFYNKDFSDSINDIIKNQNKMYDLVKDNASGDAAAPVVVPELDESQSIVESLEDIQTHFFISPDDDITDSKVLRKLYNLVLLLFCFLILQFLYQEAKALFNRLNL